MTINSSEADYAELALAVYVEELARDKRVLFVGDADGPAAERLGRRCRSLDIVSSHAPLKGSRRGGKARTRPWPDTRDNGRWDLVVAPNLPAHLKGGAEGLRTMRSWLSREGILVAGNPQDAGNPRDTSIRRDKGAKNGTSLSYEGFYDLLEDVFPAVRMLGQAPFVGWSLVDFDPPAGADGVSVDGTAIGDGDRGATRYVALCSERDASLESHLIVQVPAVEAAAPPVVDLAKERRAAEAGDKDRLEIDRLKAERETLRDKLRKQQDSLSAAHEHAEGVESALEKIKSDAERIDRALERAKAENETLRTRGRREESGRIRAERAQREAESRATKLASAPVPRPDLSAIAALERDLKAAGSERKELQSEIQRRGVLVRDLIEELRDAQGFAPGMSLPRVASTFPDAPESVLPPSIPPLAMDETQQMQASEVARAFETAAKVNLERALRAEAASAETRFDNDELRASILALKSANEDLTGQRSKAAEAAEVALRGTVRGLNARLSELTELYQANEEKCLLLSGAKSELEAQITQLAAESAVETDRAADTDRAAETKEANAAMEALQQQVSNLKQAAEQAEEAFQKRIAAGETDADAIRQRQVQSRQSYEERLAELVGEVDSLGAEREDLLAKLGELTQTIRASELAEELRRAEEAGARLRMNDREASVRELSAALETCQQEREALENQRSELAREDSPSPEEERAIDPEGASHPDGAAYREGAAYPESKAVVVIRPEGQEPQLAEDASPEDDVVREGAPEVSTHEVEEKLEQALLDATAAELSFDALVARLQRDVAHSLSREQSVQSNLADKAGKLAEVSDALASARTLLDVQGEENHREVKTLRGEFEELEESRSRTVDALGDARRILQRLAQELPRIS